MKRKLAALTTCVAVMFLAVTAGSAGKILFEDKFATLDPAWGAPSSTINVKEGKLIISPETNTTQTLLNQANLFPDDMEASITVTFIKTAAPSWGSGLVFWAKDYSEYYTVLINAEGWFAVQRHVADRYLLPVVWRESDAIKQGDKAANTLKVTTKGNQTTIAINGKEVITFNGQPPLGGSLIGVKVASGPEGANDVAFADLMVTEP